MPDPDGAADPFAIELLGVTKRYGEFVALQGIDLDIAPGEFLVLLGPSGCGKSTLLKIIAGLEDATDGEIYINGQSGELPAAERPRRGDGLPELRPLPAHDRRDEHRLPAGHAPRARSRSSRSGCRRSRRWSGLTDHLKKYPDQLSGGQRQRVALGRAIIREPVAFLMDEPLSNLDALLRVQMRTELLKLHKRVGRTTIYVTHDQIEAMTMADRIVVLRDGVMQQVGTPSEVYSRPANTFVAIFVGSPPMNLLPGRLTHRRWRTALRRGRSASISTASGPSTGRPARPSPSASGRRTSTGRAGGCGRHPRPRRADRGGRRRLVPVRRRRRGHVGDGRGSAPIPASQEGERVHLRFPPQRLRLFDAAGNRVALHEEQTSMSCKNATSQRVTDPQRDRRGVATCVRADSRAAAR